MPERLILLVSTDPLVIEAVTASSSGLENVRLTVCSGLGEASRRLEQEEVRLVLLHVRPRDTEAGAEHFLSNAAARHCSTVVLSDEYRDHQAIGFLRAGAADYLGLPGDLRQLSYLIEILTLRARPAAHPWAEQPGAVSHPLSQDGSHFVVDPGTVEMMDQLRRVVAQETTLLFTGETGTGKTRLARLIHELSPRRDQPFLVVDCGALSASLIE
ncbi:MAG: sigma 54-interacting transcriptional regulator, partial [Gemmataceae bacterium]|nr:sigma 54-interacting transcriptional regulator [Gemmataceae bacterium]